MLQAFQHFPTLLCCSLLLLWGTLELLWWSLDLVWWSLDLLWWSLDLVWWSLDLVWWSLDLVWWSLDLVWWSLDLLWWSLDLVWCSGQLLPSVSPCSARHTTDTRLVSIGINSQNKTEETSGTFSAFVKIHVDSHETVENTNKQKIKHTGNKASLDGCR